jgi:hypothetical protein
VDYVTHIVAVTVSGYRRVRRRLRTIFDRSRWVRWVLGLPYVRDVEESPGLVLVQVDGLARIQFERALKKRRMPFLRGLLHTEGYVLYSHYSGLPSSTPAVQAEIFYGVECAVPAFDFHDVTSGEYRCMFESESAKHVEGLLEHQGTALLSGGSAYCDIYAGGAEESHFCASRLGWNSIRSRLNPLRALAIVVIYFDAMIRIAALIALEFVLTLTDFFRGLLSGYTLKSELFMVPARVAVSIVMREWSTLGAEVDIRRGLPVVHINYLGYDEQAHRRGPSSRFAHWTLKGIDDSIKRLYVAAQRGGQRRYRVWVYSDHGQEATVPYAKLTGRTLDEAVKEVLSEMGVTAYAPWQRHALSRAGRAAWLRPPRPTQQPPRSEETTESSPDPCLTSKGPVAHLYLSEATQDPERDTIARALVERAEIPIVLAREDQDTAVAWTAAGRFTLPRESAQVLGPKHPFLEEAGHDLMCLAHSANAGTLLLLGWRFDGKPVSFPDEHGAHAGPGYHETHGFALLPPDAPLSRRGGQDRDYLRARDLREAALQARPLRPELVEQVAEQRTKPAMSHAAERVDV